MRSFEFIVEENNSSTNNLASILSSLRAKTDQIRVDSLINLIRKQPGSEMFNIDLLMSAVDDDPVIKNLVKEIKSDETGVKYVYLKQLRTDDDITGQETSDTDTVSPSAPENTVAVMAKRATARRQ